MAPWVFPQRRLQMSVILTRRFSFWKGAFGGHTRGTHMCLLRPRAGERDEELRGGCARSKVRIAGLSTRKGCVLC